MKQAKNVVRARHVSFLDFLKLFDEEIHDRLREISLRPGVTHLVALDNLQRDSSHFGERMAMPVGEATPEYFERLTLEQVLSTPYFRFGEPGRFQHPVAYAAVR
jgi:hypothetical protein